MKIGSTEISNIKIGSTSINKVIKDGVIYWEVDSSWTPQTLESKILFWGKASEISAGQMPNKITGATYYLTVAGSIGSETYQLPDTAPYSDVALSKWANNVIGDGNNQATAQANYNIRNIIPANSYFNDGVKIRLVFISKGGNGIISGVSIGAMTTGQTFDSAPTRVTFDGGSSSTTVTAGVRKVSDEIVFAFDKTKRYGVHVFSTQRQYLTISNGGTAYWGGSGDNTLTLINTGSTGATFQMFNGLEVMTNNLIISTEELVSYDFSQLFVKYDNTIPYTIREIVIQKTDEVLTTVEENHLRDYMQLSNWWSNILSLHGVFKENRMSGKVNFYGSNLIGNGSFDADLGWIKDPGSTISGGKLNISLATGGGGVHQFIYLEVGQSYRVSFEITDYTSGSVAFWQDFTGFYGIVRNAVGVYTENFVYSVGGVPGRTEMRVPGGFVGSIDNFSLIKIS